MCCTNTSGHESELAAVEHKQADRLSQVAAQTLLGRLLAALGPISLSTMIEYLHCKPSILLNNVTLLQQIAILLPNLGRRTIQIMTDIIDDLLADKPCSCKPHDTVIRSELMVRHSSGGP